MAVPLTAKIRNAIGGKYKTYVVTIPSAYVKNGLVKEGVMYKITLEPIQTDTDASGSTNALSGTLPRVPAGLSFVGQLSRFGVFS